MEAAGTPICLVMKAVFLSARWAGRSQRLALAQAAKAAADGAAAQAEIVMLRDTIELLTEQLACARRRLKAANIRMPYSPAERLHILWCIHYFGIPRRQIPKYFGVARSTIWRWLRRLQDGLGLCGRKCQASVRRTSEELVQLVWEMATANADRGRRHVALVLGTLGIFLAASTVRNILLRPRPRPARTPAAAAGDTEESKPRQIVARYPNHLWSADRTRVWRWGVWPTWALVAIDHFSRAVMAIAPLEGPNVGWLVEVLESAFLRHGPPKHMIADQEGIFTGEAFANLLPDWGIKHRFGAVGKHGSIAVTERLIWTLKREWLSRVPLIRGLDHLSQLLADFELYYNEHRCHQRLGGATPSMIYAETDWQKPDRSARILRHPIGLRHFPEQRITTYELAA